MTNATDEAYCIEDCGRIATDERLYGITTDHDELFEIVELVCVYHMDR